MVGQTSVNSGAKSGNGTGVPPAAAMRTNMADFAHDLTTLTELQARLFVVDCKATAGHMVLPTVLAIIGGVLAAACVPVALMGIAFILVFEAGWSHGAAFLITALGALVIGGGLAFAAWLLVRKNLTLFDRSKEELTRNLTWIKQVLKNSGRSWKTDRPATTTTGFQQADYDYLHRPR